MTSDDHGGGARLRRMEVITDAALSRLDVAGLLDAVLTRLRELLDVDTASVMVLDRHARQLVATAAKGLEEEVWKGLRVSVGHGFSGRVAQTRQPLVIADVTPADVASQVLLDKGIRSLLGVPVLAGGALVGVLHVGSRTPRRFTDEDIHLLKLAADRVSLAGQVRSHGLEQAAALALQHSLLPPQLPSVPGLDVAARYVPGHDLGIGGDWYDVFPMPSGWVGAVIGDVSGHGLRSAVVMGRIRSALRAYALICGDPAEALMMLDRKIHHFEAGSLTTALYAMISPDRGTVLVSRAGHLPPILALPGHPAEHPDVPVDPPLGIGPAWSNRRTTALPLPPGATFVCYTDGLVERRGEVIDIGLGRLRAAVRAGATEELCARLMLAAGVEQPTDDVAVLAIGRPAQPAGPGSPGAGPPGSATRDRAGPDGARELLAADFTAAELSGVRREVEAVSRRYGLDGGRLDDWVTAVNELMVNAVRHGGGAGHLTVSFAGRLTCEVSDRGAGFYAADHLDRATRPPVSPTGGMGLWIVRQMADLLSIDSGPAGTVVRIAVAVGRAAG